MNENRRLPCVGVSQYRIHARFSKELNILKFLDTQTLYLSATRERGWRKTVVSKRKKQAETSRGKKFLNSELVAGDISHSYVVIHTKFCE